MLDLLRTYTGHPRKGLRHLVLPQQTLLIYTSGDSVVISDARTLALIRVLAFWEAYPGLKHDGNEIDSLAIDSGMKTVVAAMGSRIACWSPTGGRAEIWRIHSTLVLPKDTTVTALDCKSGLLAIGTRDALSVHTLNLVDDILSWTQKWRCRPSVSHTICTVSNVYCYNCTA